MGYRRSLTILAFASLAYLPSTASAQEVAVGVKGGINLSKVAGSDVSDAKTLRGGVGGVFVALDFNRSVGMQFEALLSQRGVRFTELDGSDLVETKIRINYIDLPILVRFGSTAGGGARIYGFAGTTVSLKLGSKQTIVFDGEKIDDEDVIDFFGDINDEIETFDLGVTAGAGVQTSRLVFDLRYTAGFINISTDGSNAKNRTLTAMVGIRFK